NRNRLSLVLAAIVAGSLALAACKKQQEPADAPPAAEAPAPEPTAPEASPVPAATTVSSVDLGNAIGADNRITTPTTTFAASDTIHASVATDGPGPARLSAKWSHLDSNQTVHEESK